MDLGHARLHRPPRSVCAPRNALLALVGLFLALYVIFHSSASADDAPLYIVVLGGGVDKDGRPLDHVYPRLDRAAELFFEYARSEDAMPVILCLSQGTTHYPNPKGPDGYWITEAEAGIRYLAEEKEVPKTALMEESYSWDTVGNAYFARTLFLEPAGVTRAIVITNEWHMKRSEGIFNYVFSLPPHLPSPSSRLRSKDSWKFHFVAVEDGLEPATAAARREHEAASMEMFRQNTKKIKNLADFQRWLFTDHDAYSATRHFKKWRANLSAAALKSYGAATDGPQATTR